MGFGGGRSGGGGGGAVTEDVFVPALALFEHPTPATALFEATDGGAAGLSVQLGEPLEYGTEPNEWAIIGAQRYQGTADTPEQHSTLVEEDMPTRNGNRDYLGEFADRAAFMAAAQAHDESDSIGYLRDENDFAFSQTTGTNIQDNPSMAAIERMLGARALILPYPGSVENVDLDNRAHFANVNAAAEYVSENFDDFDIDEEWVYIDESRNGGELRLITSVTPVTAGSAATLDLATSATGGVRVTYFEDGADGNDYSHRLAFGSPRNTGLSGTEFTTFVLPGEDTTAAQALASLNGHVRLTAVYYGTEDGTTVLTGQGAGIIGDNWWTRRNFSGGSDNIWHQEAIEGEPADPIHIILDFDSEEMEIFYNRAAGGGLDGPDTLDDIRDYINTHFEGLTAEYAGGADANTEVTRPYANRSQFSGGALNGLKVLLGSEIARGADGNGYRFKARERFAGGAPQAETQATLRIYTDISRNRGVLITLEAGITDVQAEDVSSGQLGNDWVFRVLSPTDQFQGQVSLNTALREINYYAHTAAEGEQDTAVQLLNACNAGGAGVSAAYFGAGNAGTELIFAGSLGRINEGQRDFTGGLDAHAGGGEDPISVAIGPSNAKVRIPVFGGAGGVEIELTDPAGAAGDGWVAVGENLEGPASVTRNDDDRELAMRGDGSITVDSLLNHLQDISGMVGRVYGAASGNENIGFPLRREFLGGLDGRDIEIHYAPVAKGNIATPDTMGDVKAVIDATEGLSSYYYNGATAATTASRHVPWEHDFADGETLVVDLSGFALGAEENEFTGADRAAAETARDNYANTNPAWVESYKDVTQRREADGGQARVWIALRYGNDQVGQILRASADNPPDPNDWISQDIALKGGKGDKGDKGDMGDMGDPGDGVATTMDLSVANATAANVVEGMAVVFQSVTGDFFIVTEPTDTAPRIRLELPAGRTLTGVYDGGVDITADFTRQGATQVWLSNVDYNGGALALLVRTGT